MNRGAELWETGDLEVNVTVHMADGDAEWKRREPVSTDQECEFVRSRVGGAASERGIAVHVHPDAIGSDLRATEFGRA